MQEKYWRYLDLVWAQVAVGLNVVFAKYLVEHMPKLLYIEIRFALSALFLGLAFLITRARLFQPTVPKGTSLTLRDIAILIGLSVTGGFLFNLIITCGLEYTSAANAGIVSATLPAIAVCFSIWLLKEKMTFRLFIAVTLAVLGVVAINVDQTVTEISQAPLLGNSIVFLAMIPEALYTVLNKVGSKRFSAMGVAFSANLITALLMVPVVWVAGLSLDTIHWSFELIAILGFSVLASIVFYWLWARGVVSTSASVSAIFSGIMPVVAVAAGVLWLKEAFGIWQFLGMLLVLVSIILGARSQQLRKPRLRI